MEKFSKNPIFIKNLFDLISSDYDTLNDIMSFGMHKSIKKNLIKNLKLPENAKILDLCTGTGDVAGLLKANFPNAQITGVDLSNKMMSIAKQKYQDIDFIQADCSDLPFEDESFDLCTISFGLRNTENLKKVVNEINRVLKTGGKFANLDLGKPNKFINIFLKPYMNIWIAFIGKLFHGSSTPYRYLAASNEDFPSQNELVKIFKEAGFSDIKNQNYIFGQIASQICTKESRGRMKAVKFINNEIIFDENTQKPTPNKGEALIRVKLAGICNTDIEITKGYMGYSGILGHEFVGIVEDINSDDKSLIGKRVVGEINAGCGECEWCGKKLERHCPNRGTLGIWRKEGCMADYVTLPIKNLVEVPANMSDEEATLVEPFAAAFEILEQLHIKPEDKVAILGDGKLGLNIGLALSTIPCDLIHIGRHQNKLDIVKAQKVNTILSKDFKTEKIYDVVIDATGSVEGFETALALTKPRGILVLKSTVAADKPLNLAPVVIDEITILGSRCGQFKPAVQFLEKELVNLKPLIEKTFDAKDAIEAFEYSRQKGVLKVLLKFD